MIGSDIEKGALLCTHYGIVREDFKKVFPQVKDWVYQEELIPKYIKDYFVEFGDREALFSRGGDVSIIVSKDNEVFDKFAEAWFGSQIKPEIINL